MTEATDTEAKPRRLEFVCDRCLFVRMGTDVMPIPYCPRCDVRMTPDSDEPPTRHVPGYAARPRVSRRPRPRPAPADAV